jgi:type II secretion system protein I
MEVYKLKDENGFSLIEALIALAILGFCVVSILSGYTQQQLATRHVGDRNIAIELAESRMEELLKFPGTQLVVGVNTDYASKGKNSYVIQNTDPGGENKFVRTTTIKVESNIKDIQVVVEYGKKKSDKYPYRISLSSRRGG